MYFFFLSIGYAGCTVAVCNYQQQQSQPPYSILEKKIK